MIRLKKKPLPEWPKWPKPETGIDVTVCIAAVSKHGTATGQIVIAADRLMTVMDDSLPGTDTLKARKLSKTWAFLFAGVGNHFLPLRESICSRLGKFDVIHDLAKINDAVVDAYRKAFDEQFTAQYLSRYGFQDVDEFRRVGLSQLGDKFSFLCERLDDFDLGIELIIYGFGPDAVPHLIEIVNPGVAINQDLLGHCAIGSGASMALSSLRRKRMPYERNRVVYRLLEAKFSAETAAGVGEQTVLFTMDSQGKDQSIGYGSINEIKKIYRDMLEQPDPKGATEIIAKVLRPEVD